MYLRAHRFGADTSRYEDYRLAATAALLLAVLAGFVLGFYWMMRPTVVTNYGLAAYHAPPKTIVHAANSPWVPPAPSEPFSRSAVDQTAPDRIVAEVPRKEIKKQEVRTVPRAARPAREQPNSFWGFNSSRPSGSRPWF